MSLLKWHISYIFEKKHHFIEIEYIVSPCIRSFILNHSLWYTFNTIVIIIDMFTYFMDKNVYIILWGIVKFGEREFRIQSNNIYCPISYPNIVDIHIPMYFIDTCDWMLLIWTAMFKVLTCALRFFYISSANMDDIILSMEVLRNQPKNFTENVRHDDDQAPFGAMMCAWTWWPSLSCASDSIWD